MGKVLVRNVVQRKPGYLYYVDGNGSVCEAKMSRGGRKKKKKWFFLRSLFFLFFNVFLS